MLYHFKEALQRLNESVRRVKFYDLIIIKVGYIFSVSKIIDFGEQFYRFYTQEYLRISYQSAVEWTKRNNIAYQILIVLSNDETC